MTACRHACGRLRPGRIKSDQALRACNIVGMRVPMFEPLSFKSGTANSVKTESAQISRERVVLWIDRWKN